MLQRKTPLKRSAIARSALTHSSKARFIKKAPGVTARLRVAKKRRQQREDHEVYEQVDLRDGKTSRVSGIYCGDAIHRHHVVFRSQGGKTTLANVVSVTPKEHEDIHVNRTLRLTGDANKRCESGVLCGITVERHDGEFWRIEQRC